MILIMVRRMIRYRINIKNDRMGYVNNNYGEDSSLSGIVLSENEQLVRQYHCSSVKQPRCEGYLSVTTRRMIFQAERRYLFQKPYFKRNFVG